MNNPKLTPAQRRILALAAERGIWADPTRETLRWTYRASNGAAQPITAAAQSLIDAGLLADDHSGEAIGSWHLAVPTHSGCALLAALAEGEPS